MMAASKSITLKTDFLYGVKDFLNSATKGSRQDCVHGHTS